MAAYPNNTFEQVQTYQRANLAYLINSCCFIKTFNTKFKDFNKRTANLGSSIMYDLPPRATTSRGLVVNFQDMAQRQQTITCDQAENAAYAFTDQQFIFNAEQYMDQFGKTATSELANSIEANVALNANSSVPVNTIVNGQTVPTGALHTESGPFRFYGDGTTAINSYQQLAQMIANYKNFGAPKSDIKVYIPDVAVPAIVGTGLNQFAQNRNNDIAMSWELGSWGGATYYTSNLLPQQNAGTVGNENITLTVTGTNDPTGVNITQITFSGASASDANAVKAGDLFEFQDNVSGKPNLRFLTFIGHKPCAQKVQFRATANAASDVSGNVTVSLLAGSDNQGLTSAPTMNQNLNHAIQAGMQVRALPDHVCGLVVGGNAAFLAMPQLPGTSPFVSSSEVDETTGVSMRNYYGYQLGLNSTGFVNDCIWASSIPPEYAMRIAFPLS